LRNVFPLAASVARNEVAWPAVRQMFEQYTLDISYLYRFICRCEPANEHPQ
jgi:hypothetical protein